MIMRLILIPLTIVKQLTGICKSIVFAVLKIVTVVLRFVFLKGLFIAIIGAIAFLIGKKHMDNKKS